ncbi:hypothetical protein BOX15_Mlig012988g2 [Macrostomum lignano]|uniref:Tetraspanin n=1 Tax=Macrostomum lignano TaxID=282301 RepID=A0A267DMG8_9PLAT|nr:hypothetical protein BOX15_Mlig012988g2 [Macrostomum lignano]
MKESCLKLTRILLVIFNVIFVVISSGLCGAAIYVVLAEPPFSKEVPAIAKYVCIGLHGCLGLAGLLGVCTAVWPKKCMLASFVPIMIATYASHLALAASLIVNSALVKETIGESFDTWQRNYQYSNDGNAGLMDILHKRFYCCGGQSYRDYRGAAGGDTLQIPWSCCNSEKLGPTECEPKPYSLPFELAYDRGCRSVVMETTWRAIRIGLFVSVGLTALELLTIVMSLCICCLCGVGGGRADRRRRSQYSALPLPDGFPAGGQETRL